VLIAMSVDSAEDLYSWASDDQFQFLMASDQSGTVAEAYGASAGRFANRYLFVIGPDGIIFDTMIPFAEVDPTSYEALSAAIATVAQ
jgi:peroxiredoxin